MPDEIQMVTSCPLCLAPDEVQSMVTVEIDRPIGGGRTAIMICRSCAGAVVEAVGMAEPPLLRTIYSAAAAEIPGKPVENSTTNSDAIVGADAAAETQAESAELHAGEEPDDGTSTD